MSLARSIVAVLAVMAPSAPAFASSGGYVSVSTTGCGGCHGSQSIATSVVIEGPTMVVRGSVNTFTLVVNNSNSTQIGLGFNVGSTDGALMTSSREPQTQLLAGELTQTTSIPRPMSGTWRVAFDWTAPATLGAARIHAAANAVDINGGSGSTDQWNLGSLALTVLDALPEDSGVPTDSGVEADSGTTMDPGASDARSADGSADASASRATDGASEGDSASEIDSASSDAAMNGADAASDGGTHTSAPGCRCSATPTALDPRGASSLLVALALLVRRRRR